MRKEKIRKKDRQKSKFSFKNKRKRMFATLLLGMALSGIGQNLHADYNNITIDGSGNVTVKDSDYSLGSDEYVSGNDYSNLKFITNDSFINYGGIGYSSKTTPSSIGDIDASEIGGFTNNGQIDFTGTMKTSSDDLLNYGQINGNTTGGISAGGAIQNGPTAGDLSSTISGKISANDNINNNGTLTGLNSALHSGASIINSGVISDYSQITADSLDNTDKGTITVSDSNSGTETSFINLNSSLTNSGTITSTATENGAIINAHSVLNQKSGTIKNFNLIEALESLDNQGVIDNVSTISALSANAPSLVNNGTISNVEAINSTNGFNSMGTLENIGTITGATKLEESSVIKMSDPQGTAFTPKATKFNGSLLINGGTLQVRLTPASGKETSPGVDNDYYDLNNASLTVTGGMIDVVTEPEEGKEFSAGDRYTVIQGKDLTVNEELSVHGETGDDLLHFVSSYDNKNYYLDVARKVVYDPMGTTENSKNMGGYIDALGHDYVKDSDLSNVLLALDQEYIEGGPDAAKNAMAQLDGAVYGSMATMEIQNMTIVNNTLTNYLRPNDLFCCGQNNTVSPAHKMWGIYYGVDGYAKSDGNALGGDYSVSGILVGGDRFIAPNTRLGGFFAFGNTEYQVNGLKEQADADSYKAGLYFVRHAGNGYLLGNFNYGWDTFNMTRTISFLERTNTAETSGKEWAFRIEKGFNYTLKQAVFQPFGAFQYLSLNTDAFSEEGIGTTALDIEKADYNSYRTEFGGRLLWGFEGQHRTGSLFAQASWMHEYGDTCGTVSSSFNNTNNANYNGDYKYTVNGVDLGNDWCNLGVGGNITQNCLTVFGGYDFMVSSTQNLHTGHVGLAYQF